MADWGARVDPFISVTIGSSTKKTQTFKRSQNAKVNEKFEFPLPADHEVRGWELWIRVIDAQTSSPLGQITLDLNDIFSVDEDNSKREPLKLEYSSITVSLEPARFGEDVSGTVTFSLASTVALPKAVLVRESRAGIIDTDMPAALVELVTDDKQKAFIKRAKGLVEELDAAMPKLISSVGGAFVWQSIAEGNTPSIGSAGFVYPASVMGSPSNSSSSSSGVPKVKSFLSKLGGGSGSGSGSGILAGLKGTKGSPGAQEGPMADLPPEILSRIFTFLPPLSALNVRRVSRDWDASAQPQLPELWLMLNAFQKYLGASRDFRDALEVDFCIKALPFLKECIKVIQYQTSTNFLGSPCFPSYQATVAFSALSSATGSMSSSTLQVLSASNPLISTATASSTGANPAATAAAAASVSIPSNAIFSDPRARANSPGSFESISDLTKGLVTLESWRMAVATAIRNADKDIWRLSTSHFSSHWEKCLPDDKKDPIDVLSFNDPQFWSSVSELFNPDVASPFVRTMKRLIGNVEQAEVLSFTNRLRDQLERKACASPEQVPRLCELYIMLSILLKQTMDEPKAGKAKLRFGFLKDFEYAIPAECTRFLISHELMKDKTYTKFL